MAIRTVRGGKRRAAAAVEAAVVLLPLLTVIFGIFQYGRLLMDWNVLNNAAREGCRYALVNNTNTTISTQVQAVVVSRMGGEIGAFTNFTVSVTGTHNGVSTAVNNLTAGDMITVTVSGTYQFLNLPFIPTPPLTITSAVTMVCEGAM